MKKSAINKKNSDNTRAFFIQTRGDCYMWEKDRPFTVWISTVSEETAKTYSKGMAYLIEWSKGTDRPLNSPMDLLDRSKKELNELLEDYILPQKHKKRNTVRLYLASIESFLKYHDVSYSSKRITKLLPEKTKLSGSGAYAVGEIQKIFEVITTQRDKAILLLLVSSGMRRGGVANLRISDMEPIEDTYLFKVDADSAQEYVTFCTPECKYYIDKYLEERRKLEPIKDDDFLFRIEGDTSISSRSRTIASSIEYFIKKSGIERKRYGNRMEVSTIHGFRKFCNTALNKTEVSDNTIEKLMGHKNGLKGLYYSPESSDLFEKYKKAIPYLTVLEQNKQKFTITKLQSKVNSGEVETSQKVESLQKQLDQLTKEMELVRALKPTPS